MITYTYRILAGNWSVYSILDLVLLSALTGIAGVIALGLLGLWLWRNRAPMMRAKLRVAAGGLYSLAALVSFIAQVPPDPPPEGFPPVDDHFALSVVGATAALVVVEAAIGCTLLDGTSWAVLGFGAAWAVGTLSQFAVLHLISEGLMNEPLTVADALWAAGLAVASIAVISRNRGAAGVAQA